MDKKGLSGYSNRGWFHIAGTLLAACSLAACQPAATSGSAADARVSHEESVAEQVQTESGSGTKEAPSQSGQKLEETMEDQKNQANNTSSQNTLIWNEEKQELILPSGNEEVMDNVIKQISDYPSGTVLDLTAVKKTIWKKLFYEQEIPEEVKERMKGKSYAENCDVPYDELRYLRVLYRGFDDLVHLGEMIVNQSIAEDMTEILLELFEQDYAIEQMVLVDDYQADDNESMAHNNSSSFNYRNVDGTTRLSLHSYGLAVDINPLYNPYVREINHKTVILPENGAAYADRTLACEYYIRKGDICYEAFINRGFTWGGDWKSSKDFQHFQKDITG